jgi:DNA polymerase-3 subunit delta
MIFCFYGPNTFASRRKLQQMVQTYVKKTGSDFGLQRLYGEQLALKDLVSALEAVPFLANSRLVIIEYLSKNKQLSAKIDQILQHVPDSTVAVIYEGELDQRTNFYKTVSKLPKAVRFDNLTPLQLRGWVRAEVKKHDGSIEPRALERLLDIVGDDQWRLEQEVIKLVNFNSDIKLNAVEEMVEATEQQTIFELVDAIVAGQAARALKTYQSLLAQQVSPIYILSMIAWQLRNLLLAKAAGSISSAQLAKEGGMSPYVASKVQQKQSAYSETALKTAFLKVIATDYGIKTGEGEAEVMVENLIARLSQQTRV